MIGPIIEGGSSSGISGGRPINLVYPDCQTSIEIVTTSGGDEIGCPSRGSTFRLDTGSSASWKGLTGKCLGRFEHQESLCEAARRIIAVPEGLQHAHEHHK